MAYRNQPSQRSTERRKSSTSTLVRTASSSTSLHNERAPPKVDLQDIRRRLDHLRHLEKQPIRFLVGPARDDYLYLVNVTKELRGTPLYKTYYSEIVERFGDIDEVVPGTVGAYFIGCLPSTTFTNRNLHACSAICAGAVPSPDNMSGESHCGASILAVLNNDGYDFVPLRMENSPVLAVFIDNNHKFSGFTEKEKEKLARFGYKTVALYRVSADGKHYQNTSYGPMPIQDLPTRVEMIETNSFNETASTGSNKTIWYVLIAILAVIVLYFLWRYLS